ncbi:MAG: M14/M99 family metallopeptidase [Desulfobacterales bacterium]|nr:M14/M99 family metallopeptidase [Desulfobacterales bacterium]
MAAIIALLLCFLPAGVGAQKRSHSVFFEGSDYELHVYRIYGKHPGKTLLLIGGIQGDEPGGFLSADHYADISLAKGNLIVVPRANFQSIVLNRRIINEDMNRKFADDRKRNYEAKIVAILKQLIMESDCLLNLHDGSGFFSEVWESPERNPLRYGQSIIADSETYVNAETGETVQLGHMARSVIEQINKQIEPSQHHFRFNNHRTSEVSSLHREQRKSATYYALYTGGIPAYGIETSKSLPLELEVRYHNLAINAFMEYFEIIPETPGIKLEPPELRYLVISINDTLPVVVKDGQTLYVNAGDTIMISHIEANYERGLTVDIIDYGSISDLRKKVVIKGPTEIVIRRDYLSCGNIQVAVGNSREVVTKAKGIAISRPRPTAPAISQYQVRINGKERTFQNDEHVEVVKGDTFEIVDVTVESGDASRLQVNFKGYVGNSQKNTGEDRGYVIDTGKDLWQRYSLGKKGRTYQVIVKYDGEPIGKLFVDLKDTASK